MDCEIILLCKWYYGFDSKHQLFSIAILDTAHSVNGLTRKNCWCFLSNTPILFNDSLFIVLSLDRQNEMESYRKYSSRHHDSSRHHKHHKHRHRHHHSSYRYDEEEHESHRVHQRHHGHRSSDENSDYEHGRVPSTRIEKPPSPTHLHAVRRPATPPPPPPPPPPTAQVVEKPRERNWKLIADPALGKAPVKIYRYDGIIPNDPSCPEVIVQDPRTFKSKNKTISLPIELSIPKFKVCTPTVFLSYYIFNEHSFSF